MYRNVLGQISRFGITGITATAAHIAVLIVLVESGNWHPTPANMTAFLCAIAISYLGNYHWTYQSSSGYRRSIWRFVLVASAAALLNYAIFALLVDQFLVHYLLALIVVLTIVPPLSFIIQKYWVF